MMLLKYVQYIAVVAATPAIWLTAMIQMNTVGIVLAFHHVVVQQQPKLTIRRSCMIKYDATRIHKQPRHENYGYRYRHSNQSRLYMTTTNSPSTTSSSSINSSNNNNNRRMGELTRSEQIVYDLLVECSKTNYTFRIVVIGKNNTAILESTVPCLGPQIKILQSPSTGANMVTLCNDDQSFEYHIQLEQVYKIALIEKESPKNKNVLRIIRLLNESNEPITSFILRNDSDNAQSWFRSLIERYGVEIQAK